MPCWQTNQLVYEKLLVRPDLFEKALVGIKKELQMLGYEVNGISGGKLLIGAGVGGGTAYTLDLKTGQASFFQGQEHLHNLVKRNYSMAAVQSVANKSQVFRTFKMNKINERKIVLTRR